MLLNEAFVRLAIKYNMTPNDVKQEIQYNSGLLKEVMSLLRSK